MGNAAREARRRRAEAKRRQDEIAGGLPHRR